MTQIRAFSQDEHGSTAIEYALLAAMISVILIGGLIAFANAFHELVTGVSTDVSAAVADV